MDQSADSFEAMSTSPPSPRATVRRNPRRASYEPGLVEAILDAAPVCHVGIAADGPFVLPMFHARIGGRVFLHGASTSRLMRALAEGAPCCLTATLLDGLVLARSAYHHSMNFRSVVVLGRASLVPDGADKDAALAAMVERLVPGRAAQVRPPSEPELRATTVVALPLDEASAKVRTGPPLDDEDDLQLPVWAGVVPLALRAGTPEPAPGLGEGPSAPLARLGLL